MATLDPKTHNKDCANLVVVEEQPLVRLMFLEVGEVEVAWLVVPGVKFAS